MYLQHTLRLYLGAKHIVLFPARDRDSFVQSADQPSEVDAVVEKLFVALQTHTQISEVEYQVAFSREPVPTVK